MTDDQLLAQALHSSGGGTRVPGGQVLALYQRLRRTGQLSRYLVVEYRCPDPAACVLARVFTTPTGTFIHKPAYRPRRAPPGAGPAAGWPGGRPESAYLLPSFPIAVSLGCEHLQVRCDAATVRADIALAHRRRSPTGRRIRATPADTTGPRPCPTPTVTPTPRCDRHRGLTTTEAPPPG